MITLNKVNKTFTSNNQKFKVLQDISLEIPAGSIYGIIGYSGAGKSTLIRLLNGLETPTAGDVLINNQSIVNIDRNILRNIQQKIGMIFQQFNLLSSKKVLENITLPLKLIGISKKERNTKAMEMLDLVGLSDQANKYPAQLSGGQKQRVAIARALIRDPEILLCDEATSALDPEATSTVLKLLTKINQEMGITVVMVTHEMEAVRKTCQKIAVMEAGQIVETGTVTQIFEHPTSPVTKSIINESQLKSDTDQREIIDEIKKSTDENSIVLKLTFIHETARKGVVSEISREFPEVQISILGGELQPSLEGVLGYLIVQIYADKDTQKTILKNLDEKSVKVEVI